ncbi:ABC transporter permease [Niabella yanshanensis]|uniref:ABC transporter permease n=1 Tax=Niabella yanshanensis TaxID=577386 RepID=A0ABZ0W5T0_9BACT|nr:ABC transporter permease [Niabella yanshanensis]WQD38289.1 ABC transporter permease [Niabella yanshanensis]
MFKNYIKIAWRNLRNNKWYSAINIIGLGVGLASFVLVLLFLNYELSYDKWNPELDKIYKLGLEDKDGIAWNGATPEPLGRLITDKYSNAEAATRISGAGEYEILVGANDKKIYQKGITEVDSHFFKVFPYQLSSGNINTVLNAPNAAVITEAVKEKLFDNEDPIGKTIQLYGRLEVVVTGIMQSPDQPSALNMQVLFRSPYEKSNNHWQNFSYQTFIKIKKAVTAQQLEYDINNIYYTDQQKKDNLTYQQYLERDSKTLVFSEKLSALHNFPKSGGSNFKTIVILLVLAFLLLVAGAVNFSNLSIAASIKRAKEVGVRKVLGGNRRQLFWQFMGEAILFCSISLCIAILLVIALMPWFKQEFNIQFSIWGSNIPYFIFQIALSVTTVILLSGLYPSVFLSRFNTSKILKGNYSQGRSGLKLRNFLLVVQFTLSAFFVFAVIVITSQVHYMQTKDKGFSGAQIVRIEAQQGTREEGFDKARTALLSVPGVELVSKTTLVPGDAEVDTILNNYTFNGQTIKMTTVKVSADYFKTIGTPVLKGRDFNDSYADQNTRSIILNETAARLWGDQKAIGSFVGMPYCDSVKAEVVGITKDINVQDMANAVRPVAYSINNKACGYLSGGALLAKLSGNNLSQTIGNIETSWKQIEPDAPIRYSFLDENFQRIFNTYYTIQKTISFFALVAIMISAMGLFALTAYIIKERTKEIGIRKVLGAGVSDVVILVGRLFLRLIIAALLIAIPLSWLAATKWLQTFAYRIHLNWLMAAATILTIAVIVLVTIGTQAVKAAIANPVKSLRSE